MIPANTPIGRTKPNNQVKTDFNILNMHEFIRDIIADL